MEKSENYTHLLECKTAITPEYMEPIVREIWPDPYHVSAVEAMKADWDTGEVKIISYWDDALDCYEVAGITGYFFDPEAPEDVYLRWTGITAYARRRSIATEALHILIEEIRDKFPKHKRLIELVPDNEYGHTVALPFFLKFGFVKDDAFVPPNEKTEWDCIPYIYNLKG